MLVCKNVPPVILLIGFMGSGKSTVGKELAKYLDYTWIDLDQIILARSGLTSITEIFENLGEQYFRQAEAESLQVELKQRSVVISTGGGIVSNVYAVDILRQAVSDALVIFLKGSFKELHRRIGESSDRPLFRDLSVARNLFDQRQAAYAKFANVTVEVDHLSSEQVLQAIIELMRNLAEPTLF
jgi:shikimate kinase